MEQKNITINYWVTKGHKGIYEQATQASFLVVNLNDIYLL